MSDTGGDSDNETETVLLCFPMQSGSAIYGTLFKFAPVFTPANR
jgi:hypothetical protein